MGFSDLLASGDIAVRKTLGGIVTYTPGVGSPVTVTGVFDRAYQLINTGEPGVSSSGPAVFLRLSDLPSDPVADTALTVTIDGVQYTPFAVEPDGMGAVLLRLHTTS